MPESHPQSLRTLLLYICIFVIVIGAYTNRNTNKRIGRLTNVNLDLGASD